MSAAVFDDALYLGCLAGPDSSVSTRNDLPTKGLDFDSFAEVVPCEDLPSKFLMCLRTI